VTGADLEGNGSRKVYFFPATGRVLVRGIQRADQRTLAEIEASYGERLARLPAGGPDGNLRYRSGLAIMMLPNLGACLRALIVLACALAAPLAGAAQMLPPMKLLVVSDGNYPPFLFRGEDGKLKGILKDRWDLWSRATGVPVDLQGMEWTAAQQKVRDGEADVIDAFTFTEARAQQYEFAHAHSTVEARLFFHSSLGGIHELEGLRGVAVGAKAGSACAEWLRGHGVQWLRTYADVRQLIDAAAGGEVRLFCADSPVARYLLVEMGLHDQFHESQPLYTASFDWAVRGGRGDLRDFVQAGFERIPRAELDAIEGRWIGSPLRSPTARRYLVGGAIAIVLALAIVIALAARNRLLQRRAAELSDHDPITGLSNRTGIHERPFRGIARRRRPATLRGAALRQHRPLQDRERRLRPALGDRMLQVVGTRIAECVERVGLAGRMGADEFAVVLDGLGHPAEGSERRAPASSTRCNARTTSTAAASTPRRASASRATPATACTRRRSSRRPASRSPRRSATAATGCRSSSPRCRPRPRGACISRPTCGGAGAARVRAALPAALRRRLRGPWSGFEALLRWDHPGQGMIPPGEFIPILEETGEIAAVGEWVLRSVCEQIRAWELARLSRCRSR
jgi:ABC-type amino acid transport substrate-binding protein/GGDEF domain-containing protein